MTPERKERYLILGFMALCLAILITCFGAHMVHYAGKGFARLALTIIWLAPLWFFSGYMEDKE